MTDSNVAFAGAASEKLSLAVVRISMSAFNAAVVVEWAPTSWGMFPTARGSKAIVKCLYGGLWYGWERESEKLLGAMSLTWPVRWERA